MSEEDWAAARAAHARGDYAAELRIYRRLAADGDLRAQDNIGVLYERGLGVTKSMPKRSSGIGWPRRKASPTRRTTSASCTRRVTACPTDHVEAVRWYQRAAAQGDINAQHNLGNMYESGRGVAQNYAEAVAWFRKAADKGHPMAQANLGVMYELGHGIAQDLVQAHMWFALSAAAFPASEAKNRGIATRNRDEIAGRMTPAQLAEAQKLARAWRPR